MALQRKPLILIVTVLLLGALLYWFNRPTQIPEKIAVVTAAHSQQNVINNPSSRVAGSAFGDAGAAQPSASVRDMQVPATSPANVVSWPKAIASRDTKWLIEQLSVSADPNDRIRAFALVFACGTVMARPAEKLKARLDELKKTQDEQRQISQMYEDTLTRCGAPDEGKPYLASSVTSQGLKTARASGVPLAVALDIPIPGARRSGMSSTDADALSVVLKDEMLRPAWILTTSTSTLGQEFASIPAFAGTSANELSAALIAVLCGSGDDCGKDSIYRPYLCFATNFQFCSGASVDEAISAAFDASAKVRFDSTVRQLQAAMAKGDLNFLGLGKRKQ